MKQPKVEKIPNEKEDMDEFEMDDLERAFGKVASAKKDKKKMMALHKRVKSKLKMMAVKDDDDGEEVSSIKDIRKKSNKMAMKDYE